jgi:extracellular elastinolytic metalloproteinase
MTGEIWCATLCYMNRKIEERLGGPPRIGAVLGLQLVVDALKLSESNPSFLNMRDCILRALDDKEAVGQLSQEHYKKIKLAIWESFAKFAMGSGAQSNGAQLDGIVADFNVPAL